MNANVALLDETQYLRESTLSAPLWFAPQASTPQEELDELQHTWRTQQGTKVSAEPKLLIKVAGAPPSWLSETVNSLNLLLALKENWDSYGAHRINSKTAITAIQILLPIMQEGTPPPSIVPTPSGNIQLEWHRSGIDLEVEVNASGKYSISYEDATEQIEPWEDELARHSAYSLQPLSNFIDQITQRENIEE
jgi:hypothetical protein